MKYRLIVSDIDGTLITFDNKLLASTARTIRDLTGRGLLFATASARSRTNTTDAIAHVHAHCCAYVYLNGAFIETADGEILVDRPMSGGTVETILRKCHTLGVSVCCLSVEDAVATVRHPECAPAFQLVHQHLKEQEVLTAAMPDTYLMMVYADSVQPIIEYVSDFPDIETSPISRIQKYQRDYLFIQTRGINKGSALQCLADHFRVGVDETIAFGDALSNDAPLLDSAGCGVAMKNANKQLQALADSITEKDHNNDGVGHFLRNL